MRGLAVLLLTLVASTALAQPETRGPHPIAEHDAGRVMLAGAAIPVRVYYPSDVPSGAPVVLVVHGFLRNGSFMAEMARTLASRGFVAVVPNMPCGIGGCDHAANGAQLQAMLAWATSDPFVAPRVDATRRAIIGHSWGALASFVASASGGFEAVVLLDPNDDRGLASGMGASVPMPLAEIRAEDTGTCNDMWTPQVFAAQTTPKLSVRVVGSAHCDAEEPSDGLCPLACGRGDPSKSIVFRRYAVAFVSCVLQADVAVAPWVVGAGRAADFAGGVIDDVSGRALATLPCLAGMTADAGVGDALPVDAASADASVAVEDASVAVEDASVAIEDASSVEDASAAIDDARIDDASAATEDARIDETPDANAGDAGAVVALDSGAAAAVADGCHAVPASTGLLVQILVFGALVRRKRQYVHRLVWRSGPGHAKPDTTSTDTRRYTPTSWCAS